MQVHWREERSSFAGRENTSLNWGSQWALPIVKTSYGCGSFNNLWGGFAYFIFEIVFTPIGILKYWRSPSLGGAWSLLDGIYKVLLDSSLYVQLYCHLADQSSRYARWRHVTCRVQWVSRSVSFLWPHTKVRRCRWTWSMSSETMKPVLSGSISLAVEAWLLVSSSASAARGEAARCCCASDDAICFLKPQWGAQRSHKLFLWGGPCISFTASRNYSSSSPASSIISDTVCVKYIKGTQQTFTERLSLKWFLLKLSRPLSVAGEERLHVRGSRPGGSGHCSEAGLSRNTVRWYLCIEGCSHHWFSSFLETIQIFSS